MATVEELLVRISANTEQLQRELKRAESATQQSTKRMQDSLDKFDRQAAKLGSTLKTAFGLFGVGLGASELISFGKRVFETGAGLGELSEQLGVSTDALQVYQFAAVQSGVSTQELEAGLMKLTRSVGDAIGGNDKAIASFRKMGVSLLDARGHALSTAEVLAQIAEGYQRAGNKAEFLANAADVGGRSFQRLAPLLAGGRDGLNAWEKAARDAGIVLEKELIERLDRASDRIAAFWFSFERRATIATAAVLSAFDDFDLRKAESELAKVNEQLQLLAKNAGSGAVVRSFQQQKATLEAYIATLKKAALPGTGPGGGGVDESAIRASTPAGTVNLPRGENQTQFDQGIERRLATLREETAAVGESARAHAIAKAVREAEAQAAEKKVTLSSAQRAALEAETAALFDATFAEQQRTEAVKRFVAEAEADDKATRERIVQIENASKIVQFSIGQEVADLERRTKAAEQGNVALATENALLEIRNEFRAQGISLTDAELEGYRGQAERIGALRTKLDETEAALRASRDAARDFGHAIGTAFEDAVIRGDSLREVLLALYQDINRIILRVAVTQPLQQALTDWLSPSSGGGGSSGSGWLSIFGGLFGGGGDAGYSAAEAGLYAGSGFAAGGRPAPGMPALIGERGPELFVPDVAGTIVTNDNLRGMLQRDGGGGVHIGQIVIQGPVNDKSMTQLRREIATAASAGGRR